MTVTKSLDEKLRSIHQDPHGSPEFIIADAKDADMAFGMSAPGETRAGRSPESHSNEVRFKTLAEYRDQIRQVIDQQIVDIVLMSASTCEQLAIEERLFENSPITSAARANDATDVHVPRGGRIHTEAARPFRSANIDHMQCGHLDCATAERTLGANLGLYSVTFTNNLERDLETLTRYKEFREEAERKGFRHFLEVFDPNVSDVVAAETLPGFINDLIARTLAGVPQAGRPVFLKIVYHGPKAMEELVAYDPHLVVGVLGGAAGTTLDAFQLLHQAKKYGGRAALFGRKINQAENQLAFIEFLRYIADGVIEPEEAVRAYHSVLQKLGVSPHRPLEQDLTLQTSVMSYGGSSTTISIPASSSGSTAAAEPSKSTTPKPASPEPSPKTGSGGGEKPDFAKMTSEQRLKYHMDRLKKSFG
ncbi:beta/alpha barrel domain-containing protein [Schlesneria paludicola]|uniref:hypothetical protein n=1 Tax=Schlesneria paludicola TaxID=360056 RepID=UPI00029A9AA8|nr:hypothetical protein [Schlesneria paludicola]